MRDYEMMLILRPELDEEAQRATLTRIADLIARYGGSVQRTTMWGRRKLAYPLSSARQTGYRAREGVYVIYDLLMPPRATINVDRDLRLMEDVLRFLTITRDDTAVATDAVSAQGATATMQPAEDSVPVQATENLDDNEQGGAQAFVLEQDDEPGDAEDIDEMDEDEAEPAAPSA